MRVKKTTYFEYPSLPVKQIRNNLAAQIVRDIKIDTTYRNIPFGNSQLDIYSDGETAIIAVKILTNKKLEFSVQEFQMRHSKLYKFLIGKKLDRILNQSTISVMFDEKEIMKQISQGIIQLIADSGEMSDIWTFPFYGQNIVFKKIGASSNAYSSEKFLVGMMITSPKKSYPPFAINGHITDWNSEYPDYKVKYSLDYGVYRILTKSSKTNTSWLEYKSLDSTMPLKAL